MVRGGSPTASQVQVGGGEVRVRLGVRGEVRVRVRGEVRVRVKVNVRG